MELLTAAAVGDEEAFVRLTAPLRRRLHAHCYRILGSVHDADDALQETMLRAWRGIGRFEPRAELSSWLYRIATNVCLRMIEQRGRRASARVCDDVDVDVVGGQRLGVILHPRAPSEVAQDDDGHSHDRGTRRLTQRSRRAGRR
jgi:RNA polymerase sigma factor (sigma-70 family)